MIKLSKDELTRTRQILMDVWNAIAPDIDTMDEEMANIDAVQICMDYVDMYSGNGKEDMSFLQLLFDTHGFDAVVETLAEDYQLV